jgi:CHASE2 domain-containing sensor protein
MANVSYPPARDSPLVVVWAVTAIGAWGLVTVLRAKSMTQSERMMAAGGIVLVMTALAAWVIFLWPAYWD